jgi:hypothetical protein
MRYSLQNDFFVMKNALQNELISNAETATNGVIYLYKSRHNSINN